MALINQSIQAHLYKFNKYICNANYKFSCDNAEMNTYADRLNYAIEQAGKNQSKLAKAIGVKPQAIQYLCKKGVKSTYTNAIAEYLGVNATWLDKGTGSPFAGIDDIEGEIIRPELPAPIESNAIPLPGFDLWDSSTPLNDDEVALPFFREVRLAAGAGITEVQENHGAKLRFSKATLRNNNVMAEHAACVMVDGNSMEPVLPSGTTVGVDTSQTEIINGEMYAIDHCGHLRVKLLYNMPGGVIRIRSYNQDEWPDETAKPEDIRVLGWVFWYSVLRKRKK